MKRNEQFTHADPKQFVVERRKGKKSNRNAQKIKVSIAIKIAPSLNFPRNTQM